jgi:hypothetical protein
MWDNSNAQNNLTSLLSSAFVGALAECTRTLEPQTTVSNASISGSTLQLSLVSTIMDLGPYGFNNALDDCMKSQNLKTIMDNNLEESGVMVDSIDSFDYSNQQNDPNTLEYAKGFSQGIKNAATEAGRFEINESDKVCLLQVNITT